MGVVYRAHDTHLDRSVAIKILPPDRVSDADRKRRFVREAKAASALTHPNIITIHDISSIALGGSTDGAVVDFIVMEHIKGRSLDQWISSGQIPLDDVIDCAVQIASALSAAHSANIIHRDIKPANIMITESGQVKVLDFGLAKLLEPINSNPEASTLTGPQTQAGVVLGTLAYMSPEQVEGKRLDARTDVFSFGVLLYEMLTQRRPFQGESHASIINAILNSSPPSLRSFRSNVPPALQRILSRCLAKNPTERYSTATELLTDLRTFNAPPPTLNFSTFRQPRFAVPALLILLALGVIGAWFGVRSYRRNWARNVALLEISRFLDEGNFDAAFRVGKQAEGYIPSDPQLLELQRHYQKEAIVQSTPAGADVYVKGYANVDSDWIYVGKTPMENIPVPGSYLRWRVTKEGFTPREGAFHPFYPVQFVLHGPNDEPNGMVAVPGGNFKLGTLTPVSLDDFWLDKYEVTNKEFKAFVDAGGYQKREYWKYEFVKDGKTNSWEEAMSELRDATGRPGPATWQLGTYPEGQAEFPVGGVSWYEAAAYAAFAGKELPTNYHWYKAAELRQFSDILRLSNFSGNGPSQVGSLQGLSPYGSFDMAGTVREWTWNTLDTSLGSPRYILGGSWKQPAYMFTKGEALSPFDRSATNGFRCAKLSSTPSEIVRAPIATDKRDYDKEVPVNDETFAIYRSFFSYQRKDLNARIESVDDRAPYWRKETISFDAAYSGERLMAHLFIPRNAKPPFQTIVYFPSSLSFIAKSSNELELKMIDFLPRIGRAVLYPVYKGTYERHLDPPATLPPDRDLLIAWSRDFGRSIDYLETRTDIAHDKLGYYTYSGPFAPVMGAIDGRIKASFHIGAGLMQRNLPPEYDPFNFAPRMKAPTLIIAGRHDFIQPLQSSQMPLFRVLGAPEKDKRIAIFDSGHVVWLSPAVIKEIADWLDRYLGQVTTFSAN